MIPNGSPFWLRVHGRWFNLDGVEPGVSVDAERPSSTLTASGGTRSGFVARRARRSWPLSFEDATPDVVAGLVEAAGREGVEFLDESVARLNALDPVEVEGSEANPVVVLDGVPVRSLTRGPGNRTMTRDVAATASAGVTLGSTREAWVRSSSILLTANSARAAFLRFDVPPTPAGYTLTGAVVVARGASVASTLRIRDVANNWTEAGLRGSTAPAFGTGTVPVETTAASPWGEWTFNLPAAAVAAARTMSLGITKDGPGDCRIESRYSETPTILRLTYTRNVDLPPTVFTLRMTRPHAWAFGGYTDITGTAEGLVTIPGLGLAYAPGTGLRPFVARVVAADDWDGTTDEEVVYTVQVDDTAAGVVAGLRAYIVPPDGDPLDLVDTPPYFPGGRMPVPALVGDVETELLNLYPGDPRSVGNRTVTITEMG